MRIALISLALLIAVPALANSPDDILVRLQMVRDGHHKTENIVTRRYESRQHNSWLFDQLTVNVRFALEDAEPPLKGREKILEALARWPENLESYAAILIEPDAYDADYYPELASELRRFVRHAQDMEEDVQFLHDLINRQIWFRSPSSKVQHWHDATVTLSGGEYQRSYYRARYSIRGELEDEHSSEQEDQLPAWTLRNPTDRKDSTHIGLARWTVSEGDVQRVRELIDTAPQRMNGLRLRESGLSLSQTSRTRYEEGTKLFVDHAFAQAYHHALAEVVRHLWHLSGQDLPEIMRDKRPNDENMKEYWHFSFSPDHADHRVDANGVPLISMTASLAVPNIEHQELSRLSFPIKGQKHYNEPLGDNLVYKWGDGGQTEFGSRRLEPELQDGVSHTTMSRMSYIGTGFDQRRRSTRFSTYEATTRAPKRPASMGFEPIEPIMPGGSGHDQFKLGTDSPGGVISGFMYVPEVPRIPEIPEGESVYGWDAPRVHTLAGATEDGRLQGTLEMTYRDYRVEGDANTDGQNTLDIAENISIRFAMTTAGQGFGPNRAPGAGRNALP